MKAFLTVTIVCLALASLQTASARKLTKCQLAREMSQLGVPRNELPDWVCLAEHESNFDTRAINRSNGDGSWDYGIFQINDRYWCKSQSNRPSSNACRVACETLLQDNIGPAVRCAQQIKREGGGFRAWVAWNLYCQRSKPSVNECF